MMLSETFFEEGQYLSRLMNVICERLSIKINQNFIHIDPTIKVIFTSIWGHEGISEPLITMLII